MDYIQPVGVLWRDAADSSIPWVDWEYAREFGNEDCMIFSIGFLLYKGKNYIVLAGDNNELMIWGRVIKIPITNIISISELKMGRGIECITEKNTEENSAEK